MNSTSKVLIGLATVLIAALVVADIRTGAKKRDADEAARGQARAMIATAKREHNERSAAYQKAGPDIARSLKNAAMTGDDLAVINVLSPWEDVLGADDLAALRRSREAVAAESERNESDKKMLEDEAAEHIRLAETERTASIGPKPVQFLWDGSYREISDYIERLAHDPDSIEFEGCSDPNVTDTGWNIRCIYRGKNAFGAVVRNEQWFLVKHGQVTKVSE